MEELRELFSPKELGSIAAFAAIELSNVERGTEAIEYFKEIMQTRIDSVEKFRENNLLDYAGVDFLHRCIDEACRTVEEVIQRNRAHLNNLTIHYCGKVRDAEMGINNGKGFRSPGGPSSSCGSSSSQSYMSYVPPSEDSRNPDPARFRFVKFEEVEGHLVVMLEYPNCTNYEGKKVLLFKDMTLNDLFARKEIDPHFTAKESSMVARFAPTDEGWNLAVLLAESM